MTKLPSLQMSPYSLEEELTLLTPDFSSCTDWSTKKQSPDDRTFLKVQSLSLNSNSTGWPNTKTQ